MFKVSRGLSPEIVNELFQFRTQFQFQIPSVQSVFIGTECFKFLGPKVWALVPDNMKQLESLGKFRNAIKQWNLHPVLADYAKDIFTGLDFFKKKLF